MSQPETHTQSETTSAAGRGETGLRKALNDAAFSIDGIGGAATPTPKLLRILADHLDGVRRIENVPGHARNLRGRADFLDQAALAARAALAAPTAKGGTEDEALRYAESLARALHEKHWTVDAPEWQPLAGDLIGLLTQIDNMTAGLKRKPPVGAAGGAGYLSLSYGELARRIVEAEKQPCGGGSAIVARIIDEAREMGPMLSAGAAGGGSGDLGALSAGARGIYMASKTAHAPRWRSMRENGLPIISTWIDEAGKGETECFTDLWRRCVAEAAGARALIVYREADEVLKGAFVEVGAALAAGVPVFAVGCDEFSFVNHAGVTRCVSVEHALNCALGLPPAPTPDLGAQGEPVAWAYDVRDGYKWVTVTNTLRPDATDGRRNIRPLYEHPPVAAEPVAHKIIEAAEPVAGWKLVPEQITYDMLRCFFSADNYDNIIRRGWIDALAAAPTPPAGGGETERLRKALLKIAELRGSEAGEPFDDALDIADAALAADLSPASPAGHLVEAAPAAPRKGPSEEEIARADRENAALRRALVEYGGERAVVDALALLTPADRGETQAVGELGVIRSAASAGRFRIMCRDRLPDTDGGMVWPIEIELPCINGLSCWFTLGNIYSPDAAAQGYTDGALNDDLARAFAEHIVASLSPSPDQNRGEPDQGGANTEAGR